MRGSVFGGIVDDGSEEEADGDRPLVAGNDGTTVLMMIARVSDRGQ